MFTPGACEAEEQHLCSDAARQERDQKADKSQQIRAGQLRTYAAPGAQQFFAQPGEFGCQRPQPAAYAGQHRVHHLAGCGRVGMEWRGCSRVLVMQDRVANLGIA